VEECFAEVKGEVGWLDAELADVRAVLDRLLEQGNTEDAVDVGWEFRRFWFIRGYFAEGRQWMEHALAGAPTELTG
jgi:predicted ATPase